MNPHLTRAINDLLAQAAAAARLVARGRTAYDSDEMLRYAAEDLIIRLGECARRVAQAAPAFVTDHPELELRQLSQARNVVAHGYDIVDYQIVWSILGTDIPRVTAAVGAIHRD